MTNHFLHDLDRSTEESRSCRRVLSLFRGYIRHAAPVTISSLLLCGIAAHLGKMSNLKKSDLFKDAFPNRKFFSTRVDPLSLPYLEEWTEKNPLFFVFVVTFQGRKIYFKKETSKNRSTGLKRLLEYILGKGNKTNKGKDADWSKVERRLHLGLNDSRENEETRLGFRNGNTYLVKPYFTFGLRTVEEGQSHIIQTFKFPLTLCLYNTQHADKCPDIEKHFSAQSLLFYTRITLAENGVYKLPSGTKYTLISLHRNLFSLDRVQEPFPLNRDWVDPTKIDYFKKRKFSKPTLNELPPPTPFIDDHVIDQEPEENLNFSTFFQDGPFKMPAVPMPQSQQQTDILSQCMQLEGIQQENEQNGSLSFMNDIFYILHEPVIQSPILQYKPLKTSEDFRNFYYKLTQQTQVEPEKLYNKPADYRLEIIQDKPVDLSFKNQAEWQPPMEPQADWQSPMDPQADCQPPMEQDIPQADWQPPMEPQANIPIINGSELDFLDNID